MTQLNDVPENEICQQIETFILTGFNKITLEKQINGMWTIRGE